MLLAVLWRRLEHTSWNVENQPTSSSQSHQITSSNVRLLHGAPETTQQYLSPSCKAANPTSRIYWKSFVFRSNFIFISQTLSNLTCSKYIYMSISVGHFWLVKALSCIVEGGQNDSENQSIMPLCAHLGQQSNRQLTGFDHYSYLPLKLSCSRRVNPVSWLVLTTIATCH